MQIDKKKYKKINWFECNQNKHNKLKSLLSILKFRNSIKRIFNDKALRPFTQDASNFIKGVPKKQRRINN